MADDVTLLRNIGIVGQGGGGKTSLAEALLFNAGATTRIGRTADGTSVFDFEPEEIRRQLTLTTSFHNATWRKHQLTFLDMPGYANFLPDALNCMRACTGVVFVMEPNAGGAKVEAEKFWQEADQQRLPRLAFVSKMDRDHADFDGALKDIQEVLHGKPVPLQLPIGSAKSFRGVIDLLRMKALIAKPDGTLGEEEVPADMRDAAKEAHERLMESAAEVDDELVEQYLEHGELTPQQLREALHRGIRECRFIPVLCGSGQQNLAVRPLLDAIVDFLPSPAELPATVGEEPRTGKEITRESKVDAPFSAIVFKTIVDNFAGKLEVFRVVSGQLHGDATVLNVNKDTKERIGHLLRIEGKKQEGVQKVIAGEIAAVAKLKDTAAGDTLADEKAPIKYLGLLEFPAAISFALEPKSKGDEEKATLALHKLADEDPTLHIQRDAQTKEIIIGGVGQLHVEVAVERLKRKYGVEVELKAPKVPYKETIRGTAQAQGKLKKQSGGRGQYGDTWIEISPLPHGAGFEFVDDIVGGVIPRQYIPAVEKGIREAMAGGVIAGYEMVDVRVRLYDGGYHDVDSSEMAFKIAGSLGFKAAVAKAKPVLLEPIMHVNIQVPDDCMGDVIGDLNSRRGKVLGVDPKPGGQVIKAQVPMAEVLRYASDLRSLTSGRGTFTMEFAHYEEVPPHLADKIIKESQAQKAAES